MEELEEVVKELDEKVLESYYCICKYYNANIGYIKLFVLN